MENAALGAAHGSAGPAVQAKTNPLIDEDYPVPVSMRASDGYFYTCATQGPYKGRHDGQVVPF